MGLLRKAVRKSMPKPVRQVTHPVTTARRAVTPAPVRRATRAVGTVAHPINSLENNALNAVWPTGRASRRSAATPSAVPDGSIPKRMTQIWLEQNVPTMDDTSFQILLGELTRRGWTEAELEARVLPYYSL
jgi:hypothetical protein